MKTINLEDIGYKTISAMQANVEPGGIILAPCSWRGKAVLVILLEELK